MKFSIIIPNYNGRSLLEKNLPKVIKYQKKSEIIIVDDASTDQSVKFVQSHYPQLKVIRHQKNRGFAQACNSGVSAAQGDVVVLFNTDVYPESDFSMPLTAHFRNPKLFAVGFLEITGKSTRGKAIGKFEKGFLVHADSSNRKPGPTLWAFAASAAFDRKKWIELGGMDELYKPAYWEDIDLSWRAWKKSWEVFFDPEIRVRHQPESTNIKAFGKKRMLSISTKNQFLFVWKNVTEKKFIMQHLLWIPVHIAAAIIRRDRIFLSGMLQAFLQLPEALRARSLEKRDHLISDSDILSMFL